MTPAFPLRLHRTPWTTVIRDAWLTLRSLAIAACERVNEPVPAWCRRRGIAPADMLVAALRQSCAGTHRQ